MDAVLEKVDLDSFDVLNIKLSVKESDMFDDSQNGEFDEYGQSLDMVSNLRRAIKHSHPFDNKKIIKMIKPHDEQINEEGNACRDIDLEYYLLVKKRRWKSSHLKSFMIF